jgi:hypothetical protein
MAWGLLIAAYSITGGVLLLIFGEFLFFFYPEWQIYGGISLGVASLAIINVIALSNKSYIWIRVCKFVWPFIIITCAIRAIIMMVELQRGKDKIAWECDNGGQLWPDSAATTTTTSTIPSSFCTSGFSSLNTAFIASLVIDLVCQIYMFFLTWRFSKRLEHYADMKGPFSGGYYA